jgi:hypothetical protein
VSLEINLPVPTARDLLASLLSIPDYMLDQPIECCTPDGMHLFIATELNVVDLINSGNRETLVRLTGDEE